MNADLCFNSTFDNFSFSESGRFLNGNNRSSANLNGIVKAPSLKNVLNVTENKAIENNVTSITNQNQNETCNYVLENNISVDDSIFLNELTFIEKKQEVQNENIKNSEDIFSCSSKKSNENEITCSKRNQEVQDPTIKNSDEIFSCTPNNCSSDEIVCANKEEIDNKSVHTSVPSSSLSNNSDLNLWGLPDQILQKYKSRGISSMFSWQSECLSNTKLLMDNVNLIYSAPTSAGKTLVAEILAIKTVLERHKKVLFVLPFISVVREKMFYFQDILGSCGVRVEGFMGSYNPPGGFQTVQVAICTIEKANGIINRLMEDASLADLGAIIVDEMHLLGDPSRGYLLELMLTKLQYMKIRHESIQIQIIGMSATLPNLDLLGKWLKAELYVTDFRPVPLHELCSVGKEIYNKALNLERNLLTLPELETDSDNILQLCLETIQNSCSVLIFCPTKNWCENLAQQISVAFWKLGCLNNSFGLVLRKELNSNLIGETLEQLKRCPVGLDTILRKTVSYGVAFHHAGLTMDERDIIEAAFRNAVLRVLVATSTLSSGVNLPARRVIIRTPMFHGRPLDILVYKQMIGRAGRMGRDSCGESILICQKNDNHVAKHLLTGELKPIESCLEGAGKLKRAILEVIASGVASTPEDVELFTKCTLLAASEIDNSENKDELSSPINEAVEFLVRNEFIRLQKLEDGNSKYIATPLGRACLSSSLPPEEGLALFTELEKARQCFVLETELHLIYLVTPYSVCNQWGNLDWMLFLDLWEKLPSSMKRVGELIGVRESYIISGTRNKLQTNTSKLYQKLLIHKRFFTALALQDLVNEVPLNNVALKFGCARGMLQSLQQSASTFAGMLTIFSRQLGWSSVEILISQFQDRLQFGVNRDLLDLMRVPVLNGPRARALYNAGIETLVQLASSDIYAIENILYKVAPFESEKERDGESEFDANKRNKIRGIWVTGKEGLTEREAAVMLIEDARRYLQLELGLSEVKWEQADENVPSTETLEDSKPIQKTSNTADSKNDLNQQVHSQNSFDVSMETEKIEVINKNDQDSQLDTLTCSNITKEPMKNESSVSTNLDLSKGMSNEDIINDSKIIDKESLKSNGSFVTENKVGYKVNVSLNSNTFVSDQSLFEESFELNRQSATYSISQQKTEEDIQTSENTSGSGNSGDSGLDFDNESFLEHALASSFDVEVDGIADNLQAEVNLATSPQQICDNSELNSSNENNVVLESQCNNADSVVSLYNLNKTRKSMFGKRRIKKEDACKSSIIDEDESIEIAHTPKKRKIEIRRSNPTPYLLKKSKSLDLTKLNIVDVDSDETLYKTFCSELFEQKVVSLSFACKRFTQNKPLIGSKVINKKSDKLITPATQFTHKEFHVVGVNLTWGNNIAYYISFVDESKITNDNKNKILKKLFTLKTVIVRIFNLKEQIKIAKLCLKLDFDCIAEDPKVADWLIDPDGKEKGLQTMAAKYAPETQPLLSEALGNCKRVGGAGLDLNSAIDPKIRAAVETIVTWHLCESLINTLKIQDVRLAETFSKTFF